MPLKTNGEVGVIFLKFDAKAIFKSAELYRQAASVLTAAFYSGQQVVPAAITCDALALELYFKSLLTIQNGGFRPGKHDLTEYFSALPVATQEKIEAYATAVGSASVAERNRTRAPGVKEFPEFEFSTFLEGSKFAFVRFRYPYEIRDHLKKNPALGPVMWAGSPFIHAVRRIILEAHPDWAPH